LLDKIGIDYGPDLRLKDHYHYKEDNANKHEFMQQNQRQFDNLNKKDQKLKSESLTLSFSHFD
jgi:hypothetical protein